MDKVKDKDLEDKKNEEEAEGVDEKSEAREDGEEGVDKEEPADEERPINEDIGKSDILRRDLNQFVRDNQPSYNLNTRDKKSSGKLITLILFILVVAVVGGGIYFFAGMGGGLGKIAPTPSPAPTATPSPTPKPLNRSEWYLEVLNGSGVTGEAKKLADKLKALGYPVVKVANADKGNYTANQFFVKKDSRDSVDLVVLDIKDIIKIASISGELKDSTASARIIIGK